MMTPFASSLLKLAKTNASWDLLLEIVQSFHALSPLDFKSPVGDQKLPLLAALLNENPKRELPPAVVLEWFSERTNIFEPFSMHSSETNLIELFTKQVDASSASSIESLTTLVNLAPFEYLQSWRGHLKNAFPPVVENLLAWALNMENCSDTPSHLVPQLLKKGFQLTAPSVEHSSLLHLISTPTHIKCAIEAGGDLSQSIKTSDVQHEMMPLWRKIGQRSEQARQITHAWAKEHDVKYYQAMQVEQYWLKLKPGFWSKGAMLENLKNHPEWETLKNDKGQNALMLLAPQHGHYLEDVFVLKKVKDQLSHRDEEGKTLWHYLLKNQDFKGNPTAFMALKENCPTSPSSVTGRGLIAQMVLDPDSKGFVCDLNFFKKLVKHTTFDDWWASSEKEQKSIQSYCLFVADLFSVQNDKPAKNLACLILTHLEHYTTPEMRGFATVILGLVGGEQYKDEMLGLLEKGAVFSDGVELEEMKAAQKLPLEIVALLEKNALQSETRPTSPSLRMRRM